MFQLAQLLDQRNQSLYETLAQQIPIELHPSDDEYWGESIKNGVAQISWAPSNYPISCFTHELLHVEQDLAGRARPGYLNGTTSDEQYDQHEQYIVGLLPYAYNQLIHHKMFPRFTEMGFPANEFLLSEDSSVRKQIQNDLSGLRAKKKKFPHGIPFGILVYPYLCCKSPDDTSAETNDLLKQIRGLAQGKSFYRANALVKRLTEDNSPDMRRYLAGLFFLCDLPDVALGPDNDNLVWSRDCWQWE